MVCVDLFKVGYIRNDNVDACVCLQLKMGGVGPSDGDIQKIDQDNHSMNGDSIAGIDRELKAMK